MEGAYEILGKLQGVMQMKVEKVTLLKLISELIAQSENGH